MEFFLAAAYVSFFVFLIRKLAFFSIDGIGKRTIILFFLLKVLSGIVLCLIYTYYYTDRLTADTFKYFDDSKVLFHLFFTDKNLFMQFMSGTNELSDQYIFYSNQMNTWWNKFAIYNDARTMVRLNTVMRFISMGYYHVHAAIFNFISFAGLVVLTKVLLEDMKHFRREFIFLIFLFPSLTFWSSGLMKDGLIFFTLGFCLHFFINLIKRKGFFVLNIFMVAVFSTLLFYTKVHILFIFICGAASWFVASNFNKMKLMVFSITAIALIFSAPLAIKFISDKDLLEFTAVKQQENIRVAVEMQAGSRISIAVLDGSLLNLVKNTPAGLFNAFFRPHLLDINSPVTALSAIENLFLMMMMVLVLLSVKRTPSLPLVFYFSIFFVLMLFAIIGVMTPVLGTLVRYKIQGLPFLFFILLTLADKEKAARRFKWLRLPGN